MTMVPHHYNARLSTRRAMLRSSAAGFGSLALSGLLASKTLADAAGASSSSVQVQVQGT